MVDYHDSAVTSFLDRRHLDLRLRQAKIVNARLGVPQERHLEACFVPCGGLAIIPSSLATSPTTLCLSVCWLRGFLVNGQISEFENDVCYGKMLLECRWTSHGDSDVVSS